MEIRLRRRGATCKPNNAENVCAADAVGQVHVLRRKAQHLNGFLHYALSI